MSTAMSCFPSTVKGGEAWLGQFPGANVVQLKAVVQVFYGDFNRFDLNPLQFKWLIIYPDLGNAPAKVSCCTAF